MGKRLKPGVLTAFLAGFGRAIAEVGAIIIVGGNIAGYTRTMTTAIALETSKGNLPLALGLGIILIGITIGVAAFFCQHGLILWPIRSYEKGQSISKEGAWETCNLA